MLLYHIVLLYLINNDEDNQQSAKYTNSDLKDSKDDVKLSNLARNQVKVWRQITILSEQY